MARVNPPLDIRMEVPSHLKKFLKNPTPEMKSARKVADKKALLFLQSEIRKAAPKKSGALAESITVDLVKNNVYTVIAHARAVELGHYAVPIHTPMQMFLKFTSMGKEVFMRFVRTKKQPFFFPTLSKNRLKLIDIYEEEFAKMLKKIGRSL